ncbi:MAG: hypothetical protein U1F07_00170 [Rubrivivax sp.]
MFHITAAAVAELRSAARRSDAEGLALRVAARRRPDGSVEFGMGFDAERENDETACFEDLTVLLAAPSRPVLADTVLDYVEVAGGRFDFVFLCGAAADRADAARVPGAEPGHPDAGSGDA